MTAVENKSGQPGPRIMVFSTSNVSDLGIDLAGSSHMPYPPSVVVIPVPCSSGVRPEWVLYAIEKGFDGVFIAADGSDCAYLQDCTARTAEVLKKSQEILKEHLHDPRRVKMAAICSVCAESFVSHIEAFHNDLSQLEAG